MWAVIVTMVAMYLSIALPGSAETAAVEVEPAYTEKLKTDHVAVAIFDGGNVSGYFTARFLGKRSREISKDRLDAMLLDALHRVIYAGDVVDLKAPLEADRGLMVEKIGELVNGAAGKTVIEDLELDDVAFLMHKDR